MKKIPIGIMNYRELKENNYYTVDKSLMIKDFLDFGFKVTLATRPRRFGKTLNMSMMSEFFDITKNSREIFKDTAIMETEYASEINQWPTIFISFAGAKGSKREIIQVIKQAILNEWKKYKFVFDYLDEYEMPTYTLIKNGLFELDQDELIPITNSLSFLMEQMEKYYHKPVMLFIDEYDTPFIEAHVNGYYNEVKNGLSGLLQKSLKLSENLKYAFVTGIQRVAKENIFSELNNLVVCTVNDYKYSEYFGFTEEETRTLLKYYGLDLNDEVKDMYDGYHFGNYEMYNPWSIINYADTHELNKYWVNTSANKMIKSAMQQADITFKNGFEKLLKQGYLDTQVLMETSFFEQSETRSLWGLFINAGYLTIDKRIRNYYYRIKIPNREVEEEFKSLTASYLEVPSSILDEMYFALEISDLELFAQKYQAFMMAYPSYHDLISENSYHAMWIALSAGLSNIYEIKSNREEGKGRCDLILKSKKFSHPSYVIEFKYSKEVCDLEQLANDAVQQIIDKQYDIGLNGKVIYIGLAHHGKDVSIQWKQKGC